MAGLEKRHESVYFQYLSVINTHEMILAAIFVASSRTIIPAVVYGWIHHPNQDGTWSMPDPPPLQRGRTGSVSENAVTDLKWLQVVAFEAWMMLGHKAELL